MAPQRSAGLARRNERRYDTGARSSITRNPPFTHREQFHQSRLIENAIPSSISYQQTNARAGDYFGAHGSLAAQAHQQAIQWIGRQVEAQASFLAYMDAFWVLMVVALVAVPLALSLRNVKLGGAASMGH